MSHSISSRWHGHESWLERDRLMSARGLTGQCLALQRFGFEGERGLREDCLDGAGRCWMAGRCLSFRLTKDRVLCLIPDKPLSRRTRAGFRCAWSGMCRTTANRAAHAAEAYWRSLHAHAASTRAAASAVSLSVSSRPKEHARRRLDLYSGASPIAVACRRSYLVVLDRRLVAGVSGSAHMDVSGA